MKPLVAKYGAPIPVSEELLEDGRAIERDMILLMNPMMGEARLEYWMDRGGWSAFSLFKMRIYVDGWPR
jgi:hypothetical protein